MQLTGKNIIGFEWRGEGQKTFRAFNPSTSQVLEPEFYESTAEEIDQALQAAESAFSRFRRSSPEEKARLLERIAEEVMDLGEELIQRAAAETGLAEARLTAERLRTVNQLRMFAELVREGSWVEARIDTAIPDRQPIPKPDIRRMLIPLGPVVIFGASNFPLAFSVAGGDTASALAAGNPVVVKAHPAHPGTSELVGRAIQQAVQSLGMPEGLFSLLHGASPEVGAALVRHPLTRAVGFTGSLKGGRALFDLAAARPEPIPVYAEMGSINPVFVLPSVLDQRQEEFAQGLLQSVTLGVGQFCTNPGLVVGLEDERLNGFRERIGTLMSESSAGIMLTPAIYKSFSDKTRTFRKVSGVRVLGESSAPRGREETEAGGVVFSTDARTFLENRHLGEEVFGPSSLVVGCRDREELKTVARSLEGQLTASIHGSEEELVQYGDLIDILQQKVGRLIFNGFPTGVEVCPSIHHGGPYPATTDVRSTSVGTAAILRFARPVCYQNFPESALPLELRNRNERKIWRLVNNQWTREGIGD